MLHGDEKIKQQIALLNVLFYIYVRFLLLNKR